MPRRSGSSLAAFVLFVPLLAVPLLAVFGIPEFAAVSASPDDEGAHPGIRALESRFGESARYTPEDLFAPFDQHAAAPASSPAAAHPSERSAAVRPQAPEDISHRPAGSAGRSRVEWAPPEALDGWEVDDSPRGSLAHAERPVEPPATTEPLTWSGAVDRLNALGIREFRLSPGTGSESFHFSCSYIPRSNPRISHRFEAQAAEPLLAVEQVLAQIDAWQERR